MNTRAERKWVALAAVIRRTNGRLLVVGTLLLQLWRHMAWIHVRCHAVDSPAMTKPHNET